MKKVISSRYYPIYYGRRNTHYSYRSYRVGEPITSSDYVIGYCDNSVANGWVAGERGAYACRTFKPVKALPGYTPVK